MEILKKRKLIWVFLLTLITPGLGQIYNGMLKKGVTYAVALELVLLVFSPLLLNFYGMICYLAIIIGVIIFILLEALLKAKRLGEIALKPYNKWYIYLLIFLLSSFAIHPFLSWIIKNNIAKAYKIPSSGMEPTLLDGDHLIANMKPYKGETPKRGDIVIFEYPKDPSKDFIKRVIGLEGEKVEIIGSRIRINDQLIEDPWGYYSETSVIPKAIPALEQFGPVVVPKDSIFVMGDNRNNSHDSRFWGFVHIRQMKGKALYIYWATRKSRIGKEIK